MWLRVSGAANRRSVALDVAEVFISDDAEFVPLVVDLTLRGDEAHLQGEIACITPLRPGVRVVETALGELPALGRAHAAFYDAAYFAAKKGDTTRKYRRLVAREKGPRDAAPAQADVVGVGPYRAAIAPVSSFLGAEATTPRARVDDGRTLETVTFANAVAFRATYDGLTMTVDHDAGALATAAREVEARWREVFGAGAVERDRRALWYLTKYFTPHPPGEPHFFVKPFAFTRTPPGWSSVIDGVHGDGYDVLRGVVSTDTFFATPAVFSVHRVGQAIHVPAGTPLVRVIPVPRDLLGAGWHGVGFRDEPARSA